MALSTTVLSGFEATATFIEEATAGVTPLTAFSNFGYVQRVNPTQAINKRTIRQIGSIDIQKQKVGKKEFSLSVEYFSTSLLDRLEFVLGAPFALGPNLKTSSVVVRHKNPDIQIWELYNRAKTMSLAISTAVGEEIKFVENLTAQTRRKADITGIFPAEDGLPSVTLTAGNVDPGPPTLEPLMFNDADFLLTGAGIAVNPATDTLRTVESWSIDINRNLKPYYGIGTRGSILDQTKEGEPMAAVEFTLGYEDYLEIQNSLDEVLRKVRVGIGVSDSLELDNLLFETTPPGPSVGGDIETITLRGETTDITAV